MPRMPCGGGPRRGSITAWWDRWCAVDGLPRGGSNGARWRHYRMAKHHRAGGGLCDRQAESHAGHGADTRVLSAAERLDEFVQIVGQHLVGGVDDGDHPSSGARGGHWGRVGGCAGTGRGRARRHPRGPLPGFPCRPPHPDRSPARRITGSSHSPATPGFHTQNRLCACITRGLPDGTPGSYTDWGRFACGTRELPAGTPEVYTRRGRLACITREYRPVPPPG